ncbi:Trp biosynthesis-associated membrane protein [Haloechinothrix sp. YIM 98757]|uniref:Trp biosynthesis-associated membrane protein n=1 Tax=Haloechinothrix aidingensis TaxID=2752311 RepID=A0A838A9V2_9PSEU|nr:Trp biosynthesis-associated membrane protein [Haloechinothrix aidingensis]
MPEAGNDSRRRPARSARTLWLVVLGLVLGSGAIWLSTRQRWGEERAGHGPAAMVEQAETGADAVPALLPLAVLALAGIAGVLATSGWARRVLSGVLVLAGLATCALGVAGVLELSTVLPGHGLALAGGLLVTTAGLAGAVAADRMPAMGARYSRAPERSAASDPDAELWDALSAGDDPTRDTR